MTTTASSGMAVRPLREGDLDTADRVCRDAFDTFAGVENLFGDQDYVRTRWRAARQLAIAADVDGELAGSNFVTCWGSFGFFGPLSVRPNLWGRGVAKALMETTMDLFGAEGVRHAGLFTFPQSPKHLGLYQRFGFWPRSLTPILSRRLEGAPPSEAGAWSCWGDLSDSAREEALTECREVAGEIYDGLDLQREIIAVASQQLGDIVLLEDDCLVGFAVCHAGAGTEAGSGSCYVKFAALRPNAPEAEFDRLLNACEQMATRLGASSLTLGVNTARHEAYRRLLERGYRAGLVGVAMQRPNEPAWNRDGVYVIDDWR